MTNSREHRWIMKKGGTYKVGICFRCGNPVKPGKAVVMEEDMHECTYHDLGVPAENISGLMVVGLDCAKTLRRLAVEEESPIKPLTPLDVLERAALMNEKERQEMQALEPGHGLYSLKEDRLAYCDFIDQVIADQRQKAESKSNKCRVENAGIGQGAG